MTAATEKIDPGKTTDAGAGEVRGGKAGSGAGTSPVKPPVPPEKRRALGRGLEALLPGPRVVREPAVSTQHSAVSQSSVPDKSTTSDVVDPTLPQSARKDGAASESVDPRVGSAPTLGHSSSGAPSDSGASGHGPVKARDLPEGTDPVSANKPESFDGVEVRELALELIEKNPYQTRHFTQEDEDELIELGKSIQAQGLIQPITVRAGKNGHFILIAGDRRTRAAKWAGLKTIPAIIWEVSDQEAAEMTVIENLMREDLNCMDQTRAFILLSQKFHMTQAQIADRVGMSRESVSNYMRLSRLPNEVQDYLINGELEFSHARQLLKIEDDAMVLKVAQRVVKEHIPVWQLEEMMLGGVPKEFQAPEEKKSRGARWVDPNVKAAQRDLERALGMRVRIRDRNNKGRIQIEYSNLEDFDRVVGMLRGK